MSNLAIQNSTTESKEPIPKIICKEAYYCLRFSSVRTGKEYAIAKGKIGGDCIGLTFQVAKEPFKEMSARFFREERGKKVNTTLSVKPLKQGGMKDLLERIEKVTKVLVNVNLPHNPSSSHIIPGIGLLCRTVFGNMKAAESSMNIHWGSQHWYAENAFLENPQIPVTLVPK